MAHQSPMISIPKKMTEEVDWTTPIRNLISQSYGESPDNYAAECASLQRCRQDAVKGAGSDFTARDLLYKYFGQLELLELRFSEIKVNFPWHDAFTNKSITQTSIAYEKACILFQIASTHSAIAASQSRSDPEGLKRAFYYFKTCAGMLTYINENFLHAPSTDLSREVIKFLVNIILAQATEVFFEKCTDEKKSNALVSKIGSQAASLYTSLTEEVKEFMGKGIFDRNWVTLIQIKAKYFSSLAQYYRGLADSASGKYGEALARFNQAEAFAKEASRSATSFSSFSSNASPTLPADAGVSIQERTKALLTICTEKKNEAQHENDLIYHAIVPAFEALPAIEKTVVAAPIHIHEVYGAPEVQKTIGQDFFLRLVPLSVHESASVYSEEKAKLVRGEVEKAEGAEGEARSALDALGVKDGLARFKSMAEGEVNGGEEIPLEVLRWKEDITLVEDRDGVTALMQELSNLKGNVQHDLESISRDLEMESKDCEMMRVKYDHLWTQSPSAALTKSVRQDLKSNFGALEAAASSDQQVTLIWDSVKADIQLLLSPQVEQLFGERGGSNPADHLLDLDAGNEADDAKERERIAGYVNEIEERLKRLTMISKERSEVLKDLKDKIQSDDVSHLLLLNRRNTGVEPTLFAAELEKFRPYQQRLASSVHHQEVTLQEVATLWKGLKDLAGRGAGARKWEEREKKKKDTVRRFSRARDAYMEVRDGLAKGLQFYNELAQITTKLRSNVRSFISERSTERDGLVAKLETERRLSAATSSPPPLAAKPQVPPPPRQSTLDGAFSSMNLRHKMTSPPQQQYWQSNPQSYGGNSPYGATQHQQQQQQQHPSPYPSAPPPPGQQSPSQYNSYQSYGPPYQYGSPPPPQQQSMQSTFLPPPPPRPPTQSSAFPAPSAPASDPYSSLSMFNPTPSQPPTSTSSTPSAAQGGEGGYHVQSSQYPGYQQAQVPQRYLPPPPPPAGFNYDSMASSRPPLAPRPPPQQSYGR